MGTSSRLRVSRSFRSVMRKASYLHILLLPALLLLFLELPWDFKSLSPHQSSHSSPLRLQSLPTFPNPDQIRPGVSIIACCMNRHNTLKSVLHHWQKVDNVSEIVVVDWSSQPPLRSVVQHVAEADPRIRILRVEGETNWVLSRAYNLAARASSFDTLIRTDCDYSLDQHFVSAHSLTAENPQFYAGNYNHARNENEVHLNGAVYIKRDHFLRIGGYDERIQTYGWDDEDLYTRLVASGLKRHNVSYEHVSHLPHDDAARAQRDVKFVQVEIDLNSLLLKHLPKWNASALLKNQWSVVDAKSPTFQILRAASTPPALKDLVHPDHVRAAWNMALGQRLANDYQLPWDIMETMAVPTKRRLLTRLNSRAAHRSPAQPPRILFAHLMHGLGNRLRALASAMAFANSTDRELVTIWETDAHISANFSDLFADDMVVISRFKPKWPFKGYDKYDKSWLSFEFYNYMEMEGHGANKGQTIVDKSDKHFYFKSAYVIEADAQLTNWDKDNHFLRRLTPVAEVRQMIARHESNGLSNMVGIHIRDRTLDRDIKNVNFDTEYGDAASKEMEYWRQKSSYRTFISEMRRMLQEEASLKFYVATDTVDVIPKLQAEFPGKVISTPRDCDSRDGRCVRFALVDVICLSKTKKLIGSNWSSFTEAASRFGGKAPRLAGKDFGFDESKPA